MRKFLIVALIATVVSCGWSSGVRAECVGYRELDTISTHIETLRANLKQAGKTGNEIVINEVWAESRATMSDAVAGFECYDGWFITVRMLEQKPNRDFVLHGILVWMNRFNYKVNNKGSIYLDQREPGAWYGTDVIAPLTNLSSDQLATVRSIRANDILEISGQLNNLVNRKSWGKIRQLEFDLRFNIQSFTKRNKEYVLAQVDRVFPERLEKARAEKAAWDQENRRQTRLRLLKQRPCMANFPERFWIDRPINDVVVQQGVKRLHDTLFSEDFQQTTVALLTELFAGHAEYLDLYRRQYKATYNRDLRSDLYKRARNEEGREMARCLF